jgi:hypothetical protein
MSLEVFLS